jgi:hypothetical protein
MLTLVVLGLDSRAGEKHTTDLMESIVRDCGSSGRTFKSALIFTVPDAGEAVREAARNALAWEDIDDDEDTKKRIDDAQKNLLTRNLKNAQRDLDESIFRAYRHIYVLGKDNKLRPIDLGQITSSSAGSIVDADPPRTAAVRRNHGRRQPGEVDQVRAAGAGRMDDQGGA